MKPTTPITAMSDDQLAAEIRNLANAATITAAEAERLDQMCTAYERRQIRAKATAVTPGYDGADNTSPTFWRQSSVDTFRADARSALESSDLALRALDHVARDLRSGEPAPDMERIVRQNPQYAQRLRALADPDYGTGFMKLAAAGGDASRAMLSMTDGERAAFARVAATEQRALALSPDTAGGYGVPILLDPSIILSNDGATGSLRDIARVVRGVGNVHRSIQSAGSTANWYAESGEVTDDAPTPITNVDVTAHRASVFIPVSHELLDDWTSLATEMRRVLEDSRNRLETEAFVNGAGNSSNQPRGIVTALDANTNVEVVVTTNGQFVAADLLKVWRELPPRSRPNATWLMSLDVENEIRTFSANNTGAYYTVNITEGGIGNLFGRPVFECSSMPEWTGTTGAANVLIVGDFSNFLVFDRLDARLELIPNLFGATNGRPTGMRGWFYNFRTGADSVNDNAFRMLTNT